MRILINSVTSSVSCFHSACLSMCRLLMISHSLEQHKRLSIFNIFHLKAQQKLWFWSYMYLTQLILPPICISILLLYFILMLKRCGEIIASTSGSAYTCIQTANCSCKSEAVFRCSFYGRGIYT